MSSALDRIDRLRRRLVLLEAAVRQGGALPTKPVSATVPPPVVGQIPPRPSPTKIEVTSPTITAELDALNAEFALLAGVLTQPPPQPKLLGFASYPEGDLKPLGVGKTVIDLKTSVVNLYDTTTDKLSLGAFGAPYASGLYFWSDTDLNFRLRLGSVWNPSVNYQQGTSAKYYVPFDAMELTLNEAGNILFEAFPPQSLPTDILAPNTFMLRYASGSTVDAQTAVNWQSISPVAGTKSNSAAAYLAAFFTAHSMRTKTVIVFNTDAANSLKANLQGQNFPDTNWADDASTGTSVTVAAGNSVLLSVATLYNRMRLRLQSATTGSPASFVVQAVGNSS